MPRWFVQATISKRCSLVKKMLERGVDVNEPFNNETPLHIAIWNEQTEMVECLLRWGANANITVGGSSIASANSILTWAFRGYAPKADDPLDTSYADSAGKL